MKHFIRAFCVVALLLCVATGMSAQVSTTGRLVGTVSDPTGAVIVGANVKVVDNSTGKAFETTSGNDGQYSVANLSPGFYTVTVTAQGFKGQVYKDVKIVVGMTYDLNPKLEVGALEATVYVEAGAEVLETSKASVNTTIMGKSIVQLPFTSRDALDLAVLIPGAATTGRPRQTSFEGLPKGAINITYDGINVQDNLLKSSDGFFTMIRPRVDTVDEFSISTAAAGAEQSGEGAVQIAFSTKRGGNEFHGGAWWYHRNDFLNANYYFNNQSGIPRQRMRLNQFGFKVGGPIWKDKAFFFTALDWYRKPDSTARSRTILTDEATAGLFRYTTSTAFTTTGLQPWMNCGGAYVPGFVGTVPSGTSCVATLIGAANSLAGAIGATNTIDTLVAGYMASINSAVSAPGVGLSPTQPTPFQRTINFNNRAANQRFFPDFRFDYNVSQNHSLTAIYHFQDFKATPDMLNGVDPTYPVAPWNTNIGSQNSNRNEIVGAWRWNLSSSMSNEVRFGLQSAPTWFFNDMKTDIYPQGTTNLGNIRFRPRLYGVSAPFLSFGAYPRNTALGQLVETFSWTKGKHNFQFGGTATQIRAGEQWNDAAVGQLRVDQGLDLNDPAYTGGTPTCTGFCLAANFPGASSTNRSRARSLYATLAGHVTSYSASVYLDSKARQFVTGAPFIYHIRQSELGLYGSDTYRISQSLILNYGLRWELQRSPYNTDNVYFDLVGGSVGAYGISGNNNLFKPGTLTGTYPTFQLKGGGRWYEDDLNNFAPTVGLAWTPSIDNPFWKALFGGPSKTVFRAGYGVNYTREGTNNFLSIVQYNPGFQGSQFSTAANGQFVAGSLLLQNLNVTGALQDPPAFTTSVSLDPSASFSANGIQKDLRVPVVHSWSFGIQREISQNMVVELRYVGNAGVGLWRQNNLNETNIFESGFLSEFTLAQQNLSICQANAAACTAAQTAAGLASTTADSFANWGLPGQSALPILTAAFTGTANTTPGTGSCAAGDNQCNGFFSDGGFVSYLGTPGDVLAPPLPGSFADDVASRFDMMCNLAGTTAMASPWCPSTAPATGLFPVNLFRVSPHAFGGSYLLSNNGHTSYHSMQIEVRRRMAKGLQFQGSYTFSKSLTNLFQDSSGSYSDFSTIRDHKYDKGPSPWDLRHQFKFNGIWELPFGPGRKWDVSQPWLRRVIEGWEVSGIHRWQSGRVFQVTGGLGGTVNQYDGGVQLIGITPKQIQDSLGIRKVSGAVYYFPTNLIDPSTGTANPSRMIACQTAGKFCQRLFLYGPSFFRADINIVKRTKITEKVNIEFRAEFLNAFNNINFYFPGGATTSVDSTNLQSASFGLVTSAYRDVSTTDDPGGRIIQMVIRINF